MYALRSRNICKVSKSLERDWLGKENKYSFGTKCNKVSKPVLKHIVTQGIGFRNNFEIKFFKYMGEFF